MSQMILRFLNAPLLVILVGMGLGIQSALFNGPRIELLKPDIVFLVVVWIGLKRDFTEGGILSLLIGYVAELNSGAPQGLFMACMLAVFLLVKLLSKYLLFAQVTLHRRMTLICALGFKSFEWTLLALLSIPLSHFSVLALEGIFYIGVNTALAPWVFRGLYLFDLRTSKMPTHDDAGLQESDLEIATAAETASRLRGSPWSRQPMSEEGF